MKSQSRGESLDERETRSLRAAMQLEPLWLYEPGAQVDLEVPLVETNIASRQTRTTVQKNAVSPRVVAAVAVRPAR